MPHLMDGTYVPATPLPAFVIGEIRAHMGRKDLTRAQLATRLDVHVDWLSRRLSGDVGMTLEDVEEIASGLGIDCRDLFPR